MTIELDQVAAAFGITTNALYTRMTRLRQGGFIAVRRQSYDPAVPMRITRHAAETLALHHRLIEGGYAGRGRSCYEGMGGDALRYVRDHGWPDDPVRVSTRCGVETWLSSRPEWVRDLVAGSGPQ